MRKLPPLKAVRVFEAAAERESFVAAAEELGVTQGAVSQQIKLLENFLGQRLFVREGRGVLLTDVGRRYHSAVRNALNILERETVRYVTPAAPSTIKLTVLPALASLWLVPRLAGFQKEHPKVQIQISADAEMIDFARSDFHVGIRYGAGDVGGCHAKNLGFDRMYPVCSPEFLREHPVATVDDLAECRLIHDTFWYDDWQRWIQQHAPFLVNHVAGQYFTHYSLAVDAARAGGGVLMAHERLLRDVLSKGELVPILDKSILSQQAYFIVYPERASHIAAVRGLAAWISEQFV